MGRLYRRSYQHNSFQLLCKFINYFNEKFSNFLSSFGFLLCPMKDITFIPFPNLECDTHDITGKFTYSLDTYFWGIFEFQVKNIQYHAFFLSLFASLLAPLGGLFASGFKRSIEIKVK